VQAADELSFESIDRATNVDQIGAQLVRRDSVDGLADECIDILTETLFDSRHRERFHAHILPNICSTRPRTQHGQRDAEQWLSPRSAITPRPESFEAETTTASSAPRSSGRRRSRQSAQHLSPSTLPSAEA
jgi:hypothetical protein